MLRAGRAGVQRIEVSKEGAPTRRVESKGPASAAAEDRAELLSFRSLAEKAAPPERAEAEEEDVLENGDWRASFEEKWAAAMAQIDAGEEGVPEAAKAAARKGGPDTAGPRDEEPPQAKPAWRSAYSRDQTNAPQRDLAAMVELMATMGAAAKELFDYNREMYEFDQGQRLDRELLRMEMQIKRFQLFREDVRDLVELTVGKMEMYHVVGALVLECTVIYYTEGRIRTSSPPFLLGLYWLSAAGTFIYVLLCVWFSMYASISSHSFGILLTRWASGASEGSGRSSSSKGLPRYQNCRGTHPSSDSARAGHVEGRGCGAMFQQLRASRGRNRRSRPSSTPCARLSGAMRMHLQLNNGAMAGLRGAWESKRCE
eukprot:s3707_g10.t1